MSLRFGLNEKGPSSIKSIGGVSGKTIDVENADEVKQVLDRIHNAGTASNDIDWALLTYTGSDFKTLKLAGHGSGGVEELRDLNLLNDDNVGYALLRYVDTIDGATTTRFCYLQWMGDKVSGVSKARIGTNKTAVTGVIGHYNIDYLCDRRDELSQALIFQRIQAATGTLKRHDDHASKPSGAVAAPRAQPKGVTSFVPTGNASAKFVDEEGIKAQIKAVRANADPLDWLVVGYVNKTQIGLQETGTSLQACFDTLKNDQVQYAFFRISDTVDQTTQYRFVFIRFVGPDVPSMVKGKITTDRGMVEELFSPFHLFIEAGDRSECTEKLVREKLAQMKGGKR